MCWRKVKVKISFSQACHLSIEKAVLNLPPGWTRLHLLRQEDLRLHLFTQAIWGPFQLTIKLEENCTNAPFANTHLFGSTAWGYIWGFILVKNQSSATYATMHLFWAGNLRNHLKTHCGEKSYKCNQCEFASVYPASLRKHMKTHSGERSYKCNQCDYT